MKMARGDPQFALRLPLWLRNNIKVAARANGRSMNSEIVHVLSQAYIRVKWPDGTDEIINLHEDMPK